MDNQTLMGMTFLVEAESDAYRREMAKNEEIAKSFGRAASIAEEHAARMAARGHSFGDRANSALEWSGGKIVGVGKSILEAGKKVSSLFKSDIIAGGISAAGALGRELYEIGLTFQRLSINEHLPAFQDRMKLARNEAAFSHMQSGATIGGGFGFALGGPLGGAIGSLVGGAGGWLMGSYFGGKAEEIKQMNEISDMNIRRNYMKEDRHLSRARNISEWGFDEILSRQGSREGKMEEIKQMMYNIKEGSGDYSLKNLYGRYREMSPDMKATVGGQRLLGQIREQEARYDKLEMDLMRTKAAPLTRLIENGAFADAYAQKGMYVGAQVNVRDVNEEILAQLRIQTEIFRKAMDNPLEFGRFGDDVFNR